MGLRPGTPVPPMSTPLAQGTVNIATTSTPVAAANPLRSLLVLTNNSDTAIDVTWTATGAAPGGVSRLAANGIPLVLPYSGAASAVHIGVSGTKALGVAEF